MRKMILILGIVFSLSCSGDDDANDIQDELLGTWKLIEVYLPDGAHGQWTPAESEYVYKFNGDGTFTSSRFQECDHGKFEQSGSLLTLRFGCDDFTAGIERPKGTFVENFKFESNYLVLSPTYMSCDEGCQYKFQKISVK